MTTSNKLTDSLTGRERQYAEAIVLGQSHVQALKSAGYDTAKERDRMVGEIIPRKPGVVALIAELRRQAEPLTKSEAIKTLAGIVRADDTSARDKIAALERLAALHGWDTPAERIATVILEGGDKLPEPLKV